MERKQAFKEYLARQGLKSTRQRDVILDEFLQSGAHLSTEELYLQIHQNHPGIGYATVYRTLKLLAECGLAEPRHFGDGHTRYEHCGDEEHHDHLICTGCGAIIEFEDEAIERLQKKVAGEHRFTILSHRLEIFGRCEGCSRS